MSGDVNGQVFKPVDFEHPSFLFVLEDLMKWHLGRRWVYDRYIDGLGLLGDEQVLDFGCGGGTEVMSLLRVVPHGRITCVDTSGYWTRKARKRLERYPNVELRHVTTSDDSPRYEASAPRGSGGSSLARYTRAS